MKNKIFVLIILSLMLSLICVVPSEAKSKTPKISNKSVTLKIGKTKTLSVLKSGKAISKVKWKSSNKKIASVSSKGVVKAKKKGKTTIIAKVGKKQYKCKLTVKANLAYNKHVGKEHNWVWVVDQSAYDEDIYEDKPVYEDRPVYSETRREYYIAYWVNGVVFWTEDMGGTACDYRQKWATAHQSEYGSWDDAFAYVCSNTYDDVAVETTKTQTGTERVQTGTERVKTGTKHHDEVGHYECSCGATK